MAQQAQSPAQRKVTVADAVRTARQAIGGGDMRRVDAICRKILFAAPEQPEAWWLLGLVSHHYDNFAIARRLFERALRSRPEFPEQKLRSLLCPALRLCLCQQRSHIAKFRGRGCGAGRERLGDGISAYGPAVSRRSTADGGRNSAGRPRGAICPDLRSSIVGGAGTRRTGGKTHTRYPR